MAEFYDDDLPVRIVSREFGDGSEVLFQDALPVHIASSDVDGGGTQEPLPDRLGPNAQVLEDGTDLSQDVLTLGNGWYFCEEFVNNPFGATPALLEVVHIPGSTLTRVTNLATAASQQRVITESSMTEWFPLYGVTTD